MGTESAAGLPAEERLGFHVKRVEQELMALKHAALKPSGLTVPQYTALFMLDGQAGISGAALARGCLVTPQTMSTILANLEAKGLVERTQHPWHRNVLETHLTEQGRQALAVADAAAVAVERRMGAGLSAAERAQLIALLGRCSAQLAAEDA
ncbi:DNA-binding MarR family transcriptional regulator [Kitasatospora sp. MAA4]|uniref:MarR family winged helix-turn-helix transcriptional regulator n=1 Tax=Kitasatospora sp. MAA4 TaxID=3035093 RepID=UPI0024748703|nr:MarR family transcriptional regulator [Kitasatospora sp. MAA4]MDH6134459.1 DNA-binding MarR family transcriptional regulator [Kitasatospora sp. MAA4]